jgi:hypothetical protein
VAPDRRARIARKCLDAGCRPSFFYDDRPTHDLWRFLKDRQAATHGPGPQARVRENHAGLPVAFQLHHGKLKDLRWITEAYLVAGTEEAPLAGKLGVAPEAIRWFRLAFYDIEYLRHAPLGLLYHVIGSADEDGQGVLDLHRFYKIVGYKLGPAALDKLFHDAPDDQAAAKAGDLAGWIGRWTQSLLKIRQLIAVDNLSTDDPKQRESLLKLLLRERQGQPESESTLLSQIERHVAVMLGELPWVHGAAAREVFKDTELGAYDERAAELRDDELMLVAAGETVPKMENIKDLELPPAQKKAALDRPAKDVQK